MLHWAQLPAAVASGGWLGAVLAVCHEQEGLVDTSCQHATPKASVTLRWPTYALNKRCAATAVGNRHGVPALMTATVCAKGMQLPQRQRTVFRSFAALLSTSDATASNGYVGSRLCSCSAIVACHFSQLVVAASCKDCRRGVNLACTMACVDYIAACADWLCCCHFLWAWPSKSGLQAAVLPSAACW